KRGYLCGMVRGDGHLGSYDYDGRRRECDRQYQFRLALADEEALVRSARYLLDFAIPTSDFLFQQATENRRPIRAIRTHARENVERIEGIIAWPQGPTSSWWKGFLAGIFDAEGSYGDGALRIHNTDSEIIGRVREGLTHFGFASVSEPDRKGQ